VRPGMEALYRVVVEECWCDCHRESGPNSITLHALNGLETCFCSNGHAPHRIWDAPDMEWALWGALCGATMSLEPMMVGLNRKLVGLTHASWVSIAVAALEAVTAALERARDH
jgi:hypothetical protein